ncbi:hypothetical protein STRTUCAR8_09210 [Streptomyces turgidiscabies Car8]|uniref:Uncharacterized protein n=1 Tax=Streptomyces turgidiscabies (strain Car8) TaxID=698760 RepID=L7F1W2_STRT8|nr:hypothetical protein STRTUCAR8_09210 [Streptomyces turgidiscabies Car8]
MTHSCRCLLFSTDGSPSGAGHWSRRRWTPAVRGLPPPSRLRRPHAAGRDGAGCECRPRQRSTGKAPRRLRLRPSDVPARVPAGFPWIRSRRVPVPVPPRPSSSHSCHAAPQGSASPPCDPPSPLYGQEPPPYVDPRHRPSTRQGHSKPPGTRPRPPERRASPQQPFPRPLLARRPSPTTPRGCRRQLRPWPQLPHRRGPRPPPRPEPVGVHVKVVALIDDCLSPLGSTSPLGTTPKVMGPLQPVSGLRRRSKPVQVVALCEPFEGSTPERCWRAEVTSSSTAMLLQIVGEPEHGSSSAQFSEHRAAVRGSPLGAGVRRAQGSLLAVDRLSKFGQSVSSPVRPLEKTVVVLIAEVVGRRIGQKVLGQVQTHAKAPGVHGRLQYSSGRRARGQVAMKEEGGSGKILCHPTAAAGPSKGVGKQSITRLCSPGCLLQCLRVEGLGHVHDPTREEFPHPAVRVRGLGGRRSDVPACVFGPQGAQYEHGPASRGGEHGVQSGGDPFSVAVVAKVVLGFVQPHDRAWSYLGERVMRRLGTRRVEGVPQCPPLRRQRLHGFPTCPGLACRGRPDQHHHAPFARRNRCHGVGKHPVMVASDVSGEHGDGWVSQTHVRPGRMNLKVMRIPLRDRLPQTFGLLRRGRCLPDGGAPQVQQLGLGKAQRVRERGDRTRRRDGCLGIERLLDRRAAQTRPGGELSFGQAEKGKAVAESPAQLGERRVPSPRSTVHLPRPSRPAARRCSSSTVRTMAHTSSLTLGYVTTIPPAWSRSVRSQYPSDHHRAGRSLRLARCQRRRQARATRRRLLPDCSGSGRRRLRRRVDAGGSRHVCPGSGVTAPAGARVSWTRVGRSVISTAAPTALCWPRGAMSASALWTPWSRQRSHGAGPPA